MNDFDDYHDRAHRDADKLPGSAVIMAVFVGAALALVVALAVWVL
jgi:hypothetical protein